MFFSKLRGRLRIFCLRNILLFRVLAVISPRWKCLMSVNVDICLDGFPRSGNSFFTALLRVCYSNLKIAHHIHSVANILLCLKKGIPCFVLIRNPVDAITSFIMREQSMSKENLNENYYYEYGLEYYKSFYEAILRDKNKLVVINFDEYISNPKEFLDIILEKNDLGLKPLSKQEVDKKVEEALKKVKKRDKFKKISEYGSCLPNKLKDKRKLVVKKKLLKNYVKQLEELDLLYKKLVKK